MPGNDVTIPVAIVNFRPLIRWGSDGVSCLSIPPRGLVMAFWVHVELERTQPTQELGSIKRSACQWNENFLVHRMSLAMCSLHRPLSCAFDHTVPGVVE